MYKIAAAVTLLVFSFAATADEFFAVIKKVDGSKVSLTKFEKGKKGKGGGPVGDETTLTATSDVKVAKGKFSFENKKFSIEEGDAIEGGLKGDTFKKGNTVMAKVVTNDDGKITSILVTNVQAANEINARIKKVDGDKITYVKTQGGFGFGFGGGGFKKKDGDDTKKEEELTITAASNCKVTKTTFNSETKKRDTVAVDGGLKSDIFKEPVRAVIIVDEDNKAKEIRVNTGGGFNFKKKKSDVGAN